jgi:hypothetical protein
MITRELIDRQLAAKAHKLRNPCSRPRCGAKVGEECRTPNGYRTHHRERDSDLKSVPRRHRLTDAQARRIEWAAERGVYYAPGQYATLRGEAAERACADALERAGLVEQFGTTASEERMFRLTTDGWKAYHSSVLVIRRFDESRHDEQCPCVRPMSAFRQVELLNAVPHPAKRELAARADDTRRALIAAAPLRSVTTDARRVPAGVAPVADFAAAKARRAARAAQPQDIA